jgi:hypothetical protein
MVYGTYRRYKEPTGNLVSAWPEPSFGEFHPFALEVLIAFDFYQFKRTQDDVGKDFG